MDKNLKHRSMTFVPKSHKPAYHKPGAHFANIRCVVCNTIATVFSGSLKLKCVNCSATLCISTARDEEKFRSCFKNNLQRQKDEVELMKNIFYKTDEFYLRNGEKFPIIGRLKIPITVPNDRFTVHYHVFEDNRHITSESRTIKYLPAIDLYFLLPDSYPSCDKPRVILRCVWLPDDRLLRLYRKLIDLSVRNRGNEILFTWATFIQSDLFKYFDITDEISIMIKLNKHDNKEVIISKNDDNRLLTDDKKQTVILQTNPVTYTKYAKYDGVSSVHRNSFAIDTTTTNNNNNNNNIVTDGMGKKRNQKGSNRLRTVNYVNLHGNMKLVFKAGNTGDVFKYETEKETKDRWRNEIFTDGDSKRYAITCDSINDLDESNDSSSNNNNNNNNNINNNINNNDYENDLRKNENDAFNWLQLRSRIRLLKADDCTRNHVIYQKQLKLSTKIRLIELSNTKQFHSARHECLICYEDKIGSSCTLIYPCCHVFCNDCLSDYVRVSLSSFSIRDGLKCLQGECEIKLADFQLKEVLPADLFENYRRRKLTYVVETNPNLSYCPREACGNVAFILDADDDSKIMGHCRQCQFYFCVYCNKAYHGSKQYCVLKAEERKKILDEYVNSTSAKIKENLERKFSKKQLEAWFNEEQSQRWIREESKSCPKCKAPIEKFSGCNKVVCVKCNVPFCWICGRTIESDNPYEHYSNPTSPCYDKLFLGVDIDDDFDDEDDYDFMFEAELFNVDDEYDLLSDDELPF